MLTSMLPFGAIFILGFTIPVVVMDAGADYSFFSVPVPTDLVLVSLDGAV